MLVGADRLILTWLPRCVSLCEFPSFVSDRHLAGVVSCRFGRNQSEVKFAGMEIRALRFFRVAMRRQVRRHRRQHHASI